MKQFTSINSAKTWIRQFGFGTSVCVVVDGRGVWFVYDQQPYGGNNNWWWEWEDEEDKCQRLYGAK